MLQAIFEKISVNKIRLQFKLLAIKTTLSPLHPYFIIALSLSCPSKFYLTVKLIFVTGPFTLFLLTAQTATSYFPYGASYGI